MSLRRMLLLGIPLLVGGAAGVGYLSYRSAMAAASRAMSEVAGRATRSAPRYDPAMVADQPEIARRYFSHAIAPGTRLATVVHVEMRGTFLLGDKDKHQTYAMTARQVLRPPQEFVWMPVLRSGAMRVTGSDGLAGGEAWTRFWLSGLVPVANVGTSPDVLRSAQFRAAAEGLWLPSSLLPQNGVNWEQAGPDTARLTLTRLDPPLQLTLRLAENGAVRDVIGQRWSNANRQQKFQLQPFGGTVSAEASFGGFTIPSTLHMGNHYGTPDYLPFFQAQIVSARYE